jgi:hypothetical protein
VECGRWSKATTVRTPAYFTDEGEAVTLCPECAEASSERTSASGT